MMSLGKLFDFTHSLRHGTRHGAYQKKEKPAHTHTTWTCTCGNKNFSKLIAFKLKCEKKTCDFALIDFLQVSFVFNSDYNLQLPVNLNVLGQTEKEHVKRDEDSVSWEWRECLCHLHCA